jgi:hypothetical protein
VGGGIGGGFGTDWLGGGVGGTGKAPDGGGWTGSAGFNGWEAAGKEDVTGRASGKVWNEVAVVVVAGFDPMELPHVRPEKPLESDSRGSADFDWTSYS